MALQREQRQLLGSHERLEVDPGRVGTLGQSVGPLVEDLIEDLQTLVGQADLVGVGVGEQPRHRPGRVNRGLHAVLAADVAGRFGHSGQQLLESGPQVGHESRLPARRSNPCERPPLSLPAPPERRPQHWLSCGFSAARTDRVVCEAA